MPWKRMLAYVTGSVNESLLLRIDYLLEENAFAERFVKSIREECLGQFVLFGEKALGYVVREYLAHYHSERNHQGISNVIPFPDARAQLRTGRVVKGPSLTVDRRCRSVTRGSTRPARRAVRRASQPSVSERVCCLVNLWQERHDLVLTWIRHANGLTRNLLRLQTPSDRCLDLRFRPGIGAIDRRGLPHCPGVRS